MNQNPPPSEGLGEASKGEKPMNKDQNPDVQTCKSMEQSGGKIGKKGNRKKYRFMRLNDPAPKGAQGAAISNRATQ